MKKMLKVAHSFPLKNSAKSILRN